MTLSLDITLPLDRFDLTVQHTFHAHTTGLYGPSGAGKTSLLETIAGLRPNVMGSITFHNARWSDTRLPSSWREPVPPERRDIGYVPQEGLLFPHLDVHGNLMVGAKRARRRGLDPRRTLEEACDLLELGPLLRRDVTTLSGGERRRVALGRAVCSGPRLLLLDEPLAALDAPLRRKILPYLQRLRQALAIPMVVVSHDPAEMLALCDEVVLLREGVVRATGAPEQVLGDPHAMALDPTSAAPSNFDNVLQATLEQPASATTGDRAHIRLGGVSIEVSDANAVVTGAGSPGDSLLLTLPARAVWWSSRNPSDLPDVTVLPAQLADSVPTANRPWIDAGLDDGQIVRVWATAPPPGTSGDPIRLLVRGGDCRLHPARAAQSNALRPAR